jgi:hypothetical protein
VTTTHALTRGGPQALREDVDSLSARLAAAEAARKLLEERARDSLDRLSYVERTCSALAAAGPATLPRSSSQEGGLARGSVGSSAGSDLGEQMRMITNGLSARLHGLEAAQNTIPMLEDRMRQFDSRLRAFNDLPDRVTTLERNTAPLPQRVDDALDRADSLVDRVQRLEDAGAKNTSSAAPDGNPPAQGGRRASARKSLNPSELRPGSPMSAALVSAGLERRVAALESQIKPGAAVQRSPSRPEASIRG